MIIDFHSHIVPPSIKERRESLISQDPCFRDLYSDPKAKMATAEDLIESMDRDGIDLSVVTNIGWTRPDLCRETNDYIMESVAKYSGRPRPPAPPGGGRRGRGNSCRTFRDSIWAIRHSWHPSLQLPAPIT